MNDNSLPMPVNKYAIIRQISGDSTANTNENI